MKPPIFVFIAAMLLATPSLADPGHKGGPDKGGHHDEGKSKGKGKSKHSHEDRGGPDHNEDHDGWHHESDHGPVARRGGYIVIGQPQLVEIRQQAMPYYQRHCPPGQAKKGRCGNYNYVIGQPLPMGAPVWAVPQPVLVTLPPPPPQAQYVMVDRNLLLISEGTRQILDGMLLLSGVQ